MLSCFISIHAAREGGDGKSCANEPRKRTISIHAAREGGDSKICERTTYCPPFQSTPPVKAATDAVINIRKRLYISIHAAREGGDRSVAV